MPQIKTKNGITYALMPLRAFALVVLFLALVHPVAAQQNSKKDLEKKIRQLKARNDFNVKDTVYIDLLNELGSELRFYKTDSLLLLSKEAIALSKEIDYEKGQCEAMIGFGNYYSDKGDFQEAIMNFGKALEIAEHIQNTDLILTIKNDLAGEHGYKGDYALALEIYLQGIEMAEQIDNKEMLSIMNENVANLYASQKDYKQALDFFKKVKKINAQIGNEVFIAQTTSNMASAYADMGELEYAMFNVNSSIAILERHKIMDWLAYAYEIKGKTYLKQKKFKWALHWYRQSEMLHEDLNDTRSEIDLLNGMAEAYLGIEQDSISKTYALKAFRYSKEIRFKEGTQKCAQTLYRISKNEGDYGTALHYHEVFQRMSDTLSRIENQKSLNMLKTKVEYDRQKEAWELANQKARAEQRYYVYAALVILLIFLTVTILVRRSEKIQKNLNTELNSKKDDLEKRESQLSEINETKDKLFSIIAHDLRGPIGAFQGLLKMFRDGEMNQKEFEGFIPKLRKDIDHIAFTLNNLLSWGQSQMNGLTTKQTQISVDAIVNDNINLLSEIAETKSIRLVSRLPGEHPGLVRW